MSIESQNVTDYPNTNTIFMVWKLNDHPELKDTFRQLCALVLNLNNSVANRFPDSRASGVMGIGCEGWKKLELPTPMPKELVNFEEIKGGKHTAVSTPGDLHFHLRADNKSLIFDMAIEISRLLSPVAESILEISGFKYWDARSILGFVDGAENPHGEDRDYFAKIGEEDLQYKGGSYLFVQKYLHNMDAWKGLSTEEQEKVIGRSKENDIEMSDAVKPSNSHIALANIEGENGEELKIVRDNMPFGRPSSNEFGTYFIAYSSTFSTTKKMLTNMFVGDPVGNYDRILDFSTAMTGTLFFVPTRNMLDEFSG
ncbi:peroxidase [Chryseobacterium shigense]|uniref:Putative iron-dependent peroxidase n=1 Tax=Chryseobacterium shigense TaxID=297244 RepID=A0A1N7J522_9FLAO|nr:Dyp-type peroxidase [Chryseobacterium shigense]PQA93648.1 peroxidase [Chryseobacterium shigense]SIS44453.1 putative iron-dependent peroxidase [Chryseobacterium shigense]